MDDEIDIWSLVDRLPGWNWVLPRIGDNRTMTWWDARLELDSHPFGMKQPVPTGSPVPTIQIDVFLVPGLGFDAHGNRIGRGAGYYDRELAKQRPDSLAIGVTTEARIVDQLPVEPHDRPMTHLVTEFGVRETTPTR